MSEDLLEFPCDLPIKVFGRNDGEFRDKAFAIVQVHVESLQSDDITQQSSREGRFLSLTINIRADSRAQVDAIYQDLSSSPDVLMVL